MSRIAETVRQAQEARGLTGRELAERSTIDNSELEAFYRGESEIPLHAIFLIAGALGVRPKKLLAGVEWVADEAGGGRFQIADSE